MDEPKHTEAATALLINNSKGGRILILVRTKWENEGCPFQLPGGGIEEKEHPWECAVREMEEETGIHLFEHDLKSMYILKTEWTKKLYVFSHTMEKKRQYGLGGSGIVLDSSKFCGMFWLNVKERKLLEKIYPLCIHGLQQIIKKEFVE